MKQEETTGPAAVGGNGPALPHDRDETASAPKEDDQHRANRAPIRQAHEDVESGLVDTERLGTPNDVPSSGQRDRR